MYESRKAIFYWIGSLVIIFGYTSTRKGSLTFSCLDEWKIGLKRYLKPEAYAERTALANIIPTFSMDPQVEQKLSDLFLALDRANALQNLTELFKKSSLNIVFPQNLIITQFLMICDNFNVSLEDVIKVSANAESLLLENTKIQKKLDENKQMLLASYDKSIKENESNNEKEVKMLVKSVLEKKLKHYKEKPRIRVSKKARRQIMCLEQELNKLGR